jgi:Fic-DOC domain mobile mystery protein B
MSDQITKQPEGASPLDDISELLRNEITTRRQLDEAESLNILEALEWTERGRLEDVFTVAFYQKLHTRMFDEVWGWAGRLRSVTGVRPNIGVPPEKVPSELGRVAMEFSREWNDHYDDSILPFVARYHHSLVAVHPFNNGNGRWSRLACDVVVKKLARRPPIIWATDTLNVDSKERAQYIAALKRADSLDYEPLIDYLAKLNSS